MRLEEPAPAKAGDGHKSLSCIHPLSIESLRTPCCVRLLRMRSKAVAEWLYRVVGICYRRNHGWSSEEPSTTSPPIGTINNQLVHTRSANRAGT
jgi:hypothetical protein